jgi:CRISPR-associated protein Cmr6
MDMNQNLSQLFYIKEDSQKSALDGNSFISDLNLFGLSGNAIHGIGYKEYFSFSDVTKYQLTTTYPGLLVGSGYSHPSLHKPEKKEETGDFQLGFFFDHTTGLPVIPGSSVKGILKSVFPQKIFKEKEQRDNRLFYIREVVRGINSKAADLIDEKNWDKIFFGEQPKRKHIFCDAYIEEIPGDGRIFEDDYITPHHDNPFKEPTPIRFMKIAPAIIITFQFVLYNYTFENGLSLEKEQMKKVFKQIILDFGIGAKRNVGYGHFNEL